MMSEPPSHTTHDRSYLYNTRDCAGGCGRDIDERVFACSHCLERLPEKVHDGLIQGGPGLLPALARARIYFGNTTPGKND